MTNNLLIGARKRENADLAETSLWDPVANIYMWSPYAWEDEAVLVTDNLA